MSFKRLRDVFQTLMLSRDFVAVIHTAVTVRIRMESRKMRGHTS